MCTFYIYFVFQLILQAVLLFVIAMAAAEPWRGYGGYGGGYGGYRGGYGGYRGGYGGYRGGYGGYRGKREAIPEAKAQPEADATPVAISESKADIYFNDEYLDGYRGYPLRYPTYPL